MTPTQRSEAYQTFRFGLMTIPQLAIHYRQQPTKIRRVITQEQQQQLAVDQAQVMYRHN